ncbi:MAG: hypothetical protein Q8R76_12740 [Candidatus Omnitrophota bacterium]|nr:hypothetical protein [Candidatus Omnitrophota bacterium]
MKKIFGISLSFMMALTGPGLVRAEVTGPQFGQNGAGEEDTYLQLHNADIQDVLRLIAEEYDLNIVIADDVVGTISMRLKRATLVNTLDAILLARGYDYDIHDNIIRVAPVAIVDAERAKRVDKQELEALVPEVIALSYLDANDILGVVQSLLTSRGSVRALERRAHKGFRFGSGSSGDTGGSSSSGGNSASSGGDFGGLIRSRVEGDNDKPRSNTLLVVDIRSQIERIKEVIREVDVAPQQVLIDARILEVDTDTLEDLGLDFNSENSLTASGDKSNALNFDLNSDTSSTGVNSGIFTTAFPGASDAGLRTIFRRLNGEDFTAILHLLLQDERTKTLSAPKILTIENQEAAILVGEQFPIFESNVSDQGTVTETLSFFQPIGISLQVLVQVTPNKDINMIIHPTVSSIGAFVTGTSGLTQPRINIREADTRVLIKNGETLVIGGLLEDIVDEKKYGIPFLKDMPLVGNLFTRRQVDIDQRNLLIFITPRVVGLDDAALSETEQLTYQALEDPAAYGFLHERRSTIDSIFEGAKTNFETGHPTVARAQFLRVLSLDPHHKGAIKHLKELEALPRERPIG